MKNKEDLTALSVDELQEKLEAAQDELYNLNIQKATHQLTNPMRIKAVRKEIARIKTFIRQHELGLIKTVSENE